MMATVSLLTTSDNPYDPFDEWDAWYAWDMHHGYHTPGLLARFTITSIDQSESDQDRDIEFAMREIVELNLSGVHVIVTKEYEDPPDRFGVSESKDVIDSEV